MRFLSYEPLLGPLDGLDLAGIDWVIVGGESGPGVPGHRARRHRTAGTVLTKRARRLRQIAGRLEWPADGL
ncbi:DUF5131 family protein [Streptomyces umbrinus]|uniref:DUF5131 family protein n=1 Tax=Streptomyces umbrinus TaxID=67370 RepID=UPI003407B33E